MSQLLHVEGVSKSFYGNQVLHSVGLSLMSGEVLAIVGENGAGKSTLIKILAGIYQLDEGSITIAEQTCLFANTKEAEKAGVGIIHQELNLISQLSIAENFFLGREPLRFGLIDWATMRKETAVVLKRLGLNLDPKQICSELTVEEQQMVEIARASSKDVKIMIMDEPTAALNDRETKTLFALIKRMKAQGMGILYISHRLDEIAQIADRIMVLRDGREIITCPVKDITREEIVFHMVGRDITNMYPRENTASDKTMLEVHNLSVQGLLENISFSLHKGEILGVAGLMGCGKKELADALFGRLPYTGEIMINGQVKKLSNPSMAIKFGIGFVPEDRKGEGLMARLSTRENISLPNLNQISQGGFISSRAEKALLHRAMQKMKVRTHDEEQPVGFLSGGNQQKVVLGKWVEGGVPILILNEPTRGIDVGARTEIYRLLNELTAAGTAALLLSSDLPEVLGMSDRVLVMHEGRITAKFDAIDATQEKVMHYAVGGN
ncbi:MAG TPA: D-xylose ABC transporter ATP-binding protein [Desulfosporosinus sp.]|jgi:ribose transport system ATP-binding protein|nr:D-xylose ABC transporter ATP-binding protein [Desulfosporosinus sp.]